MVSAGVLTWTTTATTITRSAPATPAHVSVDARRPLAGSEIIRRGYAHDSTKQMSPMVAGAATAERS
ncbi:hypothetical protein C5C42_12355 [Rathayibacter sp. AY1F7]|nr:hypothetical protein C5C54_15645 [Rathayibacter sp. AY1F2]PPG57896.1 hypothetical protein C5C69_13695 [Rathayibacter sp. AY1C7]PPH26887.1 hypothetical protein C5C37_15410 [Rathayibacter sp. AY1F9]PPH44342.1 hypothetical protein C5C42_12355 [Rathayibacter sp. AY1F7]PPH50997.1 hypothetical protein C5C67_12495 [Rathayibacter sp. AY1E1]